MIKKEVVNSKININYASNVNGTGVLKAFLYEGNPLAKLISKYANSAGLLFYTSSYDFENDSLVFDFVPKDANKIHACALSKIGPTVGQLAYTLRFRFGFYKKGPRNIAKRMPLHVPNEMCSFKGSKLIIKLSQNKQKQVQTVKKTSKPVPSDVENQCHKLMQVLPDVMLKKFMESDDLATKLANTVDYRTNRDLKALEKSLFEEMDKRQEQMEKNLSADIAAGLNEIQDRLNDWLNH